MVHHSVFGRAAAAFALILTLGVASANAGTITFNFAANPYVATQGGVTLTYSGWYANDNTFATATANRYVGAGLGVCNGNEDGDHGCSSPEHSVDNGQGGNFEYDFVLFNFSAPVDLVSVELYRLGCDGDGDHTDTDCITSGTYDNTYDVDASWFSGNGVTTLTGKALNNMPAGFGSASNSSNNLTTVSLDGVTTLFDSLLFGASLVDRRTCSEVEYWTGSKWKTRTECTGDNDYFKIKSITVNYSPETPDQLVTTPVPEPGTIALFGLGLVGVATAVRRRRQAN